MNNSNKIIGQIFIILGMILVIYGIIPFFIPISCIVLGAVLINHGLKLMNIRIFRMLMSGFVSNMFKFKQ